VNRDPLASPHPPRQLDVYGVKALLERASPRKTADKRRYGPGRFSATSSFGAAFCSCLCAAPS
jgi:hypothetical protein